MAQKYSVAVKPHHQSTTAPKFEPLYHLRRKSPACSAFPEIGQLLSHAALRAQNIKVVSLNK